MAAALPQDSPIVFHINPKDFQKLTDALDKVKTYKVNLLKTAETEDLKIGYQACFLCLVEKCADSANDLKIFSYKDIHLREEHDISSHQSTEIYVSTVRELDIERRVSSYTIDVMWLSEFAEFLTKSMSQTYYRLECFICLLDNCGFGTLVTDKFSAPKAAYDHLLCHNFKNKMANFDFTLLTRQETHGIPVQIRTDEIRIDIIRKTLLQLRKQSYIKIEGLLKKGMQWKKYIYEGLYFCLLNCGLHEDVSRLMTSNEKIIHLQSVHLKKDNTWTKKLQTRTRIVEIRVSLILTASNEETNVYSESIAELQGFAQRLIKDMSNLPFQYGGPSRRLACFLCEPGCDLCICVVGSNIEKEISTHLQQFHSERREQLYKKIFRITLVLDKQISKDFYYPAESVTEEEQIQKLSIANKQEKTKGEEEYKNRLILPISFDEHTGNLFSIMKSLTFFSAEKQSETPGQDSAGKYYCLIDGCAVDTYNNPLMCETEKFKHFDMCHKSVDVAEIYIEVIWRNAKPRFLGLKNVCKLKNFAAEVINGVSERIGFSRLREYACFLCFLCRIKRRRAECKACRAVIEVRTVLPKKVTGIQRKVYDGLTCLRSSVQEESKKHLQYFHKIIPEKEEEKGISFLSIILIVKREDPAG